MEHSSAALPAFLVAQTTPFCGKTVISGWVERLKSQTLKKWKFQEYLINFAFVFLLHLLNARQWCVICCIKIIPEVLSNHKTSSQWWLWQGDIAEQWESNGLSKSSDPLNVHLGHGGVVGGFPGGSGVIQLQCRRCRRHGFSPWPGKVLWKRKWQPIPVFLPRRIPWTEESGRLQFIGSQRTGHDWRNLACSMYLLWPCDSSSSPELKRNASKFPPNKNIGMFIVALFVAYSNRK